MSRQAASLNTNGPPREKRAPGNPNLFPAISATPFSWRVGGKLSLSQPHQNLLLSAFHSLQCFPKKKLSLLFMPRKLRHREGQELRASRAELPLAFIPRGDRKMLDLMWLKGAGEEPAQAWGWSCSARNYPPENPPSCIQPRALESHGPVLGFLIGIRGN